MKFYLYNKLNSLITAKLRFTYLPNIQSRLFTANTSSIRANTSSFRENKNSFTENNFAIRANINLTKVSS